jgi:hypothetical protein
MNNKETMNYFENFNAIEQNFQIEKLQGGI